MPSYVQLFATPWTVARRLLYPWNISGRNIGLDSNCLLQGIFPTQGLTPGLCCRQILSCLSHQGSPLGLRESAHFRIWTYIKSYFVKTLYWLCKLSHTCLLNHILLKLHGLLFPLYICYCPFESFFAIGMRYHKVKIPPWNILLMLQSLLSFQVNCFIPTSQLSVWNWEGESGWGTHVNPWPIHVNVWQKTLQ